MVYTPIRTDFGCGLLWLPRCYNLPGCNASCIPSSTELRRELPV